MTTSRDRRAPLACLVLPALLACAAIVGCGAADPIDHVRLIWREDPARQAVLAWTGGDGVLHLGRGELGTDPAAYPQRHAVTVTRQAMDLTHRFVRLENLEPATAYSCLIVVDGTVSRRYRFRTAPDHPAAFAFVAGGDSRNHRDARRAANTIVRKLRPLFVAFAGDMTDDDTPGEWHDWLEDWELTTGEDGLLIPIVAARGNHEKRNETLVDLFDSPHPKVYFSLGVGGDFFHLITLNSEIHAGGAQAAWLAEDLAAHDQAHWTVAQYHRPMRPHVERKEERLRQYRAWAQLFYDHGVELVIECDSHCVKTTWPLRPSTGPEASEGFVRDDERGTVYVGEGCWGAPLRPADDPKPWTRASGSFNQVKWIHVHPDRMEVRTVAVDNAEAVATLDDGAPFAVPAGLAVWEPETGAVVRIDPLD